VYCIGHPARDCAGPCGDRVRRSLDFVADQFIGGRRMRIGLLVEQANRVAATPVGVTTQSRIQVQLVALADPRP
jgi:hypothetical protein